MTERFQVNPAKVVHETIEGEAILIHLENGFYYSLDGAGAAVWGLLASGVPVDEASRALAEAYAADGDAVAADVRRLADELQTEDLLEPAAGGSPNGAVPVAADGAWATPALRRYEDMKDFLLVDPIHETADAGWPHPREGA